MLQLVQTTSLDPEQSDYIQTAIQSSKRLSRLLSDILDLSRVEAGKLSLQLVSFDLEKSMRQVQDLFEFTGREKGVALEIRIDPEISHRIIGDPTRLQQVLINLVGNAFKFITEGDITVEAISLSPLTPRHPAGALQGCRHRRRHPQGQTGRALLAVHPGAPGVYQGVPGGRAGAVHLQAFDRVDGREHVFSTLCPGKARRLISSCPSRRIPRSKSRSPHQEKPEAPVRKLSILLAEGRQGQPYRHQAAA